MTRSDESAHPFEQYLLVEQRVKTNRDLSDSPVARTLERVTEAWYMHMLMYGNDESFDLEKSLINCPTITKVPDFTECKK